MAEKHKQPAGDAAPESHQAEAPDSAEAGTQGYEAAADAVAPDQAQDTEEGLVDLSSIETAEELSPDEDPVTLLEGEVASLKDQLLRAMAETENVRNRARREREESVKYARQRKPFGKPLSANQAIQWPLIEMHTQAEMLRLLIRKTAWDIDRMDHKQVERTISDRVSMCNYWANRLCCEAADQAMQVHGGIGYSRHKPFEHIYRHHRRYRITEGSEEIQMRKVGAYLFGYLGPRRAMMQDL